MKLPSASNRSYSHALRGERAIELTRYCETENVIYIMASLAGLCYANTADGPADTVDFLNFFEEAHNSIDPITNQAEDIIVMDNAQHNAGSQILGDFLGDLGIELVNMLAYSPDFNLVEYIFGKLRTLMKYQFRDETACAQYERVFVLIAIGNIWPGDMAGIYYFINIPNSSLFSLGVLYFSTVAELN